MAESDATTTTPADDGRAHVQRNGTVDTGGKPAFVWCEDETTGHRFDLPVRALPKKGVKVVEGYPLNFKRLARNAKTRLQLAGDPAETDVQGDVDTDAQAAPPADSTGDQAHAVAAAAAPDLVDGVPAPVEAPAPEVAPSGDTQHKEAATAADPEAQGDGDADAPAATTKTRRTAR